MENNLPLLTKPFSSQIFLDPDGNLWTGRPGSYIKISSGGGSSGNFVTTDTPQEEILANKGWLGKHHFDGALSIPLSEPLDPTLGKAYVFLGSGESSSEPDGYQLPIASMSVLGGVKLSADFNISPEGVLTIAASGIPTNLTIGARTSTQVPILNDNGLGVVLTEATSSYAGLLSAENFNKLNSLGFYTGKTGISVNAATKEISPVYGTTAGTVAQGNDSRIVNAVPNSRAFLAGNGLLGGGDFTVTRAISVNFGTTSGTVAQGNDPRILAGQLSADNPYNLGMVLENRRDYSFEFEMNNITAYPNLNNTTLTKITSTLSPTGRALQFVSTGWAETNVRIPFANLSTPSGPSKIFLVRLVAKIPVGWSIFDTHNTAGFGSRVVWLTGKEGTGYYREYLVKFICGDSGTFNTINHFDLRKTNPSTTNPSGANPVTSLIAYAEVMDLSESYQKTRLRISLTAPANPLPGDIWIE